MSNPTVNAFYAKDSYQESYDSQHGSRLDAVVEHWGLRERLKGKRVVDVGGGLGFLGKRLGPEVEYHVIDGADIDLSQHVCEMEYHRFDLDRDQFASYRDTILGGVFDAAFCLETLEHLSSPYHCIEQIKKLVKPGGDIYLSVPPYSVTHNTIYPGLLWPRRNWEVFLWQCALGPFEYWPYVPKDRGWPAECYRCTNAPWSAKRLLFAKDEVKFLDCTALEATNL